MKTHLLIKKAFFAFFFLCFSFGYTQIKKNVIVAPNQPAYFSRSDILKSTNQHVQTILNEKSVMDQVIADDLIVQGSGCFGFDCVNNESFGFSTILLKENNLRIRFEDTSTSTFPANDWELLANESASGGKSKFSIEDITGAKTPFTIEAGAKTNALYVNSFGRIGIGTSTPVLDAEIMTGNTPAIRLNQTNGSGFVAQTWDMAGNETNFYIRDVTNGNRLPFRISSGAPSNSIYIQSDGQIKIVNAIIPNSDIRLKKNFESINDATGIIKKLNPLKYDFRYDELKDMGLPKTRQFGLIAQELETVVPELVSEFDKEKNKDTYKGINYTGLIPILIKGLQEQQAEIESLKAKLANYEAVNARLARLEAILNNEEKDKKTDDKK
jgi:hypothetical protein